MTDPSRQSLATDLTGRFFISYRRARLTEVRLLHRSLADHGIPVWTDLDDLGAGPVELGLESVIADPSIAGGILWITPEIASSRVIQRTEGPRLLERTERRDGFLLMPVAAGGLDYREAAEHAEEAFGLEDLSNWNLEKVASDPATGEEIDELVRKLIGRRVRVIHEALPADEPLVIDLFTRDPAPFVSGHTLTLDWYGHFEGRMPSRKLWPSPELFWQQRAFAVLDSTAKTIGTLASGRPIAAGGKCAITAAVGLGLAFMETRQQPIAWSQFVRRRPNELWSLDVAREDCGFEPELKRGNLESRALAVMVSVTGDVPSAIQRSRKHAPDFPAFGAYLHLAPDQPTSSPEEARTSLTPETASDLAQRVVSEWQQALRRYRDLDTSHLFISGPLGLAMMIGQQMNTLGRVQLYEYDAGDRPGIYTPTVLVTTP